MRYPNFFLVSREGYGLDSVYECRVVRPVALPRRDDLILVECVPPIPYQGERLLQVILAARHSGYDVRAISDWPFYVHVGKVAPISIPDDGNLEDNAIETIAWAELHQTKLAALAALPRQSEKQS